MNEALQNLLTRRSCRKYKPEQIAAEELDAILQAGVYAPTGRNGQSPIIVAVQTPDERDTVERLNAAVMGNPEMKTFYGAPTVIVVFGDSESPFCASDGNLVIGNLLNAAHAVGVDSCYIWRAKEAFESDEGKALKAKWGVPERYVGLGNVILGYGEEGGVREAAPRKEGYVIRV